MATMRAMASKPFTIGIDFSIQSRSPGDTEEMEKYVTINDIDRAPVLLIPAWCIAI